jgi:hypothetical protein
VPVTFTDSSRRVKDRYREASRMALVAGGALLVREIKKAHGDSYYKGGKYRTGQVRQSIKKTRPFWMNGWMIQVGTKLIFPLYWELGHRNKFSGKYERVRIWTPTYLAQVQAIQAEFAATLKRYMA